MGIEDLRSEEVDTSMVTIYGHPGVGKTVAGAQLAPKSVLLTNENGQKVLKYKHPKLYARVIPMQFEGFNSFGKAIRAIKAEPDAADYQLLVDTVSGMQTKKIMENLNNKDLKIPRDNPEIPAWGDYHLSQKQWTPIIQALASCGVNVTLLSHLRVPNPSSPQAHLDTVRPDLTKAVFNLVNQYSNVVALMSKDGTGTKRMFTTQGTASMTAKDQVSEEQKNIPDDVFIKRILQQRGY